MARGVQRMDAKWAQLCLADHTVPTRGMEWHASTARAWYGTFTISQRRVVVPGAHLKAAVTFHSNYCAVFDCREGGGLKKHDGGKGMRWVVAR